VLPIDGLVVVLLLLHLQHPHHKNVALHLRFILPNMDLIKKAPWGDQVTLKYRYPDYPSPHDPSPYDASPDETSPG
jgi:hypothetical protein